MSLSTPPVARSPRHVRRVNFQSFEREDGLWDIEAELLDTKAVDMPRANGQGIRKAGEPIHHMFIRCTVDTQLVVHAIEASMPSHPFGGCTGALQAMQKMVGCSMARGWRKSIETHLGQVSGCTHLRELLGNMATAAFQSIISAFTTTPEQPPAYLGRCTGWDFNGEAVATFYPQFQGWRWSEVKGPAVPPSAPNTAATAGSEDHSHKPQI